MFTRVNFIFLLRESEYELAIFAVLNMTIEV